MESIPPARCVTAECLSASDASVQGCEGRTAGDGAAFGRQGEDGV